MHERPFSRNGLPKKSLRVSSGPWMAAPPVEGGPCVRGPACLMGIRHAANGRAARGVHGSGVQRPGWRSLGRSMDQCHLNWVCTECAQRSRQGPDPSFGRAMHYTHLHQGPHLILRQGVGSTCVVEYMVTDGVTWAYHERGRLRPEGVKVIEKCDGCDVWMSVV